MKLVLVSQFYPPDYAATGQLLKELTQYLGLEIQVITGQPSYEFTTRNAPKSETVGLVSVKRLPDCSRLAPGSIRGTFMKGLLFSIHSFIHVCLDISKYNLLLVTTAPPFLPVIGYLINVLFGLPYICILYDLHPDISVELGVVAKGHPLSVFWTWVNKRVWRRAKKVIVLSRNMKERVVEYCPEIEEKVEVIHSWAEPKNIYPIEKERNWFALKYKLLGKFTVLYSGNLGRCHDIDTIFEAALRLKGEPIEFICIGRGAKKGYLEEKVRRHNLDNLRFLPYQDVVYLTYSLSSSDLSLVSIIEGMESLIAPSKLYGYLASGRPVAAICPETSYIRDILEEGRCGKAFVNGDSEGLANFIKKLSQNKRGARMMGDRARQYLERNFTPEIIAHQYLSIILEQGK